MMEIIKEMEMHSINTINGNTEIMRVLGGFIYIFTSKEGIVTSTCFVPELIKENKNSNDNGYHENWIVDYQDKNLNRKSKHLKFSDKKHEQNWMKKWEEYGNKIIGCHKANALGELTK